ncbi:winged helix DNA-binding domain-containing protein [Nonomuraea sp. H19]|uniref:winged helix DNA-binding domain-containing protein n=1 Tax=Nonomuraea sp. H19 TaxID=3452206 RepID=UPI003F8A7464
MILNRRVLNRTALDRQLLLSRSPLSAAQAIERLVAVQGQEIDAPYLGLWSRLAAFTQDDLADLLHGRQVVRGSLLRGTQHLALAGDYVWIRPLVQVILSRTRQAAWGRLMRDVDPEELALLARKHLAGRTLTRPQLRDLLRERWPEVDPMALGFSAQALLPIVHPPPNGIWGRGGATPFTLAEEWLGRSLEDSPPVERLVVRYLAAFGPASVMDVQMWAGLTRLRPVVEAMPFLRKYQDAEGRVLYDLARCSARRGGRARSRTVPALVRQPHRRVRRPQPVDDRRAAQGGVRGRRHLPHHPRRRNCRWHVGP